MNTCILMAEVIQDPQLRYTPDNQTPISEMVVQFPGMREEDPPATLKVVGWGNLAQEIQERYHQGDRIIVEGRLNMNTVDRQEGFKEKRAELTAQKIYLLGADSITSTSIATSVTSAPPAATPATAAPAPASSKPKATSKPAKSGTAEAAKTPAYTTPSPAPADYDDIPF
jgi:single-strand DNA-binding protein